MVTFCCIYFTLTLFWPVTVLSFGLEEHQAAFVQTGDELHYFNTAHQLRAGFSAQGDSKSVAVTESAHGRKEQTQQLRFNPPKLRFGTQSLGVPNLRKVVVNNPTEQKIRFDAISGSTLHFHCSFFEHKTVEPGGSTSLDIVFLPRAEGLIETTLFIYTSLGVQKFEVSGHGSPSPYRLRPYISARVPLNGTFNSLIRLHNPHPTTLKVVEMFTSGGDLHLEPSTGPPGNHETERNSWDIPPYRTRVLMQARFLAAKEKNTTAYVRIRTNSTDEDADLVVPFDMMVSAEPGLYSPTDLVDFGRIRPDMGERHQTVSIINASNRSVMISSVTVEPYNSAMKVLFTPLELRPGTGSQYVAKLIFDASKADRPKVTGNIVIQCKTEDYKVVVPYQIRVLQGSLTHDPKELAFYVGQKFNRSGTYLSRNITLTSTCNQPLAVYELVYPPHYMDAIKISLIGDFPVLQPHTPTPVFSMEYRGGAEWMTQQPGYVMVYTNASRFTIPFYVYSGKLRVTSYSMDEEMLDFGTLSPGDYRSLLFAVTNENAVPVTLLQFSNAIEGHTKLQLIGIEAGNHSILAEQHNPADYTWKPKQDLTIPAHSFAVFKYTVLAPNDKAQFQSVMIFRTAYEVRFMPVSFSVEEFSFFTIPHKIVFEDAFPGKISAQSVQLYSTLERPMVVLRLSTLSHDPRIFFENFEKNLGPVVHKNKAVDLGRAVFFPIAGCVEDCYVGLPLNTDDGNAWIYGIQLPPELPEIDSALFHAMYAKWEALVDKGQHIVNATVVIDTTDVKGYSIPAEGKLVWPRILKETKVHFPLTAVHNTTVVNLTLHNPSSLPTFVQIVPLPLYPHPEELLQRFRLELFSLLTDDIELEDLEMFSLQDSELYNVNPESPVSKLREALEATVGVKVPRFTLAMILQPGMKVRLRVGFRPRDFHLRSSVLLIRNNLTVLEMVPMYGRAGRVDLRVGRQPPFSSQPLILEVPEKQLRECETFRKTKKRRLPVPVVVNKAFTVKNTGEIPLMITNISINGVPCENRGFRVLGCEPFYLEPNGTKDLEILFLPDFTQTWYEARLQLYIGGASGALAYTMACTVPREYLPKCLAATPRPAWEPIMYYICVTALMFLLMFCVACAYLEGDRIITCAIRAELQARKVFDLRNMHTRSPPQQKQSLQNGDAGGTINHTTNNRKLSAEAASILEPETPSLAAKLLVNFYFFAWKPLSDFYKAHRSALVVAPNNGSATKAVSQSVLQAAEKQRRVEPKSSNIAGSSSQFSGGENHNNNNTHHTNHNNNGGAANNKAATNHNSNKKRCKPVYQQKASPIVSSTTPPKSRTSRSGSEEKKLSVQELVIFGGQTYQIEHVPASEAELTESKMEKVERARNNRRGYRSSQGSDKEMHSASETPPVKGTRVDKIQGDASVEPSAAVQHTGDVGQQLEVVCPEESPVEAEKNVRTGNDHHERDSFTMRGKSPFAVAAKLTAKVMKRNKNENASESEDSTLPDWEMPSQNIDEAFDQLSQQTESFANNKWTTGSSRGTPYKPTNVGPRFNRMPPKQLNRQALQQLPIVQGRLSSSSRSSSTSSLDSTSSSGSPRLKMRPSPRQKKVKAAATFGVIGSPKLPKRRIGGPTEKPRRRHHKSPPAGTPMTPDKGGVPVAGSTGFYSPILGPLGASDQPSIMQQLQFERKQRLQDYYRVKNDDWPGADLPPVIESLWDDEFLPWKNPIGSEPAAEAAWPAAAATWSPHTGDSPNGSAMTSTELHALLAAGLGHQSTPMLEPLSIGGNGGSKSRRESVSPPEDSSIVAWGPAAMPPLVIESTGSKKGDLRRGLSANSSEPDFSWTVSLLDEEQLLPKH